MAAEISLKSNFVRKQFERKLLENIRIAFKNNNLPIQKMQKGRGKILLQTPNHKKAIQILKKVFGIHSIAKTEESYVESMPALKENVLLFAKIFLKKKDSFALRVNRLGKHNFSSREIAVQCGNVIMQSLPFLTVNLSNPKKELFIELDGNQLLLFTEKISGAKGLPIGTQGKIGVLFEGKKLEFLAGWLMLKRGCRIFPIILKQSVLVQKHLKQLREWNNFESFQSIKAKSLKDLKLNFDAIASAESQLNAVSLKKIEKLEKENDYLFLHPLILYSKDLLKEQLREIGG